MLHTTSGKADQRNGTKELWGLGDLLTLAVARVTAPVEGVHRALAGRSLQWTGASGVSTRHRVDTVIAAFYDAIRLTGSAVGTTVGMGATIASRRNDPLSGSLFGSRVQAAINATWGDELEQRGNDLRIEMGLRDSKGKLIHPSPETLAAAFPGATPKVVILIHGLGRTENCWQKKGDRRGLWQRVSEDRSTTPVMVRYNTGRHISENGSELARLLEQVWQGWPTPIESIALVGHSMGGLVIRSACRAGEEQEMGWLNSVNKVVTVGTPHLGAPLEKAANVVSWSLRATPESSPIADFLDARSVGIKDLRFGSIAENDWLDTAPDALLRNTVSDLPLWGGAEHHFVAAVITSDPTHPVGGLLGDLMVRPASGIGQGRRRRIDATEVRVLGGRRHFDLIHDVGVLDQVVMWLTNSRSAP